VTKNSHRAELVYWLNQVAGDAWVDEPWTNRLIPLSVQEKLSDAIVKYVTDPLAKEVCKHWGHVPTRDHCGLPKHDYCLGCGTPTPGQATHGSHY